LIGKIEDIKGSMQLFIMSKFSRHAVITWTWGVGRFGNLIDERDACTTVHLSSF
jgi:hypothetical protein